MYIPVRVVSIYITFKYTLLLYKTNILGKSDVDTCLAPSVTSVYYRFSNTGWSC
jgi:hypothetical protein